MYWDVCKVFQFAYSLYLNLEKTNLRQRKMMTNKASYTQPQAAVFQKLSMVEDEQWSNTSSPPVTLFHQEPILSSRWKEGHWCMDVCSHWSIYLGITSKMMGQSGGSSQVWYFSNITAVVHDSCPNCMFAANTLGVKHRWSSVCCTGQTLKLNSALEHPNIEKANSQQIISNIWAQAHSGHKHKAEQYVLRVHDELTALAKVARSNAVHLLCCCTEEVLKSTQMSAYRSALV